RRQLRGWRWLHRTRLPRCHAFDGGTRVVSCRRHHTGRRIAKAMALHAASFGRRGYPIGVIRHDHHAVRIDPTVVFGRARGDGERGDEEQHDGANRDGHEKIIGAIRLVVKRGKTRSTCNFALLTLRRGGVVQVTPMQFFFYADNLNPTQLKRRAPEHRYLGNAYLPDHTIQFCRWSSQWRCGLASVAPSQGEKVWGIVAEITDEDLKLLDEFEGEVPAGAFRHVPVSVITDKGEKILVTTHAATPIGKFK